MYRLVLKFVDALLEYFQKDGQMFEKVLYLRHEIRSYRCEHDVDERTAADILNRFSNNTMPTVVNDVVERITEKKMEKWVNFLRSQKSPAYTEPSSSNASSSSYSSSSSS